MAGESVAVGYSLPLTCPAIRRPSRLQASEVLSGLLNIRADRTDLEGGG
ncbi:MAG TPA: hypothetical protein VNM47_14625 [Terriglobia bacterium]|nr:hypothetical protein [Terriglobia bacterium]